MSTYCVEHELLVRALKESERANGAAHEHAAAADTALAAEAALTADTALTAAAPESATP